MKCHWSRFLHCCSMFIPAPRCAVALTRQHSITFSAFKLGASSLTRHLDGLRMRSYNEPFWLKSMKGVGRLRGLDAFYLFILLYSLFKNIVNNSNDVASNQWIMNSIEFGVVWLWPVWGYYPGICLERLGKTMKTLDHDSCCPGWDSNQLHSRYFGNLTVSARLAP